MLKIEVHEGLMSNAVISSGAFLGGHSVGMSWSLIFFVRIREHEK